jgi:hypothetical protein
MASQVRYSAEKQVPSHHEDFKQDQVAEHGHAATDQ